MEKDELFITCKRFGGTKFSYACAHYDRYRSCRRYCHALRELMLKDEDFKEKISLFYGNRTEEGTLPSRYSCSRLPVAKHQCPQCGFVAKSERGLKRHTTMSHNLNN